MENRRTIDIVDQAHMVANNIYTNKKFLNKKVSNISEILPVIE